MSRTATMIRGTSLRASSRNMMPCQVMAAVVLVAVLALEAIADEDGPFGRSKLSTVSGTYLDGDAYFEAGDCGECHAQQYRDWRGSLHHAAHHDPLYRAFAERARAEGGDELYLFCSACHAPNAVGAGEIPHREGRTTTFLTDEGVTCETCHSAKGVRRVHRDAGANASLVLDDSDVRYGPLTDPAESEAHESAYSEVHTRSLFCSACHTLVHPHNGLVIENTYAEWEQGPYAAAGIQCQDCHMRTVEESIEVARTMKPIEVPGTAYVDGEQRPNVFAHLFIGANANGERVGADEEHSSAAVRRLQSAATIDLQVPREMRAGDILEVGVHVTNVGAGHALPSSITELRQIWIDLEITDVGGTAVYRSGAVDDDGRVDPEAVMYHSVLTDQNGDITYLPWRAEKLAVENLIPPKATARELYRVPIPSNATGPLSVRAVLRYRSAPQEVLDELFGKGKLPIRVVDMVAADATVQIGP